MAVIPEPKLPPEAMPWAREITKLVQGNGKAVERAENNTNIVSGVAASSADVASQAAGTATIAQTTATDAQTAAVSAASAASAAQTTATSKGRTFTQATAPDAGTYYTWLGTAFNSKSTKTNAFGVKTNEFVNGAGTPSTSLLTVRTNLVASPRAAASTPWAIRWYGPTADGNVTYGAYGPSGRPALRKTWTVKGTGAQDLGIEYLLPQGTITAGKTYSFSAWSRASWETTHIMTVVWKDAAGATISNAPASPAYTRAPGVEALIQRSGLVAPALATAAMIIWGPYPSGTGDARMVIPEVGDTLDSADLLVVEGIYEGPYFDGSTTAAGDYTYGWVGVVNNSQSNQRGLIPTGWAADAGTANATVFTSSEVVLPNRAYSVKAISKTTSGDLGFAITVAGLKVNTKYTLSYWIYSESLRNAALDTSPTVEGNGLGFRQVPARQWVQFVASFTTTAAAGTRSFWAHHRNGPTVTDQVAYFADLMISEGDVAEPYFDGSFTDDRANDLWINTTNNANTPTVWSNGTWITKTDSTATTALTAANGKNKIIFATTDATGTTGYVAGDIWFKKSGALIVAQWEFVGGAWAARTLDNAVIANLDAGKIVTGTLDANRISANSIFVSKIAVGDFTDFVPDPYFRDPLNRNAVPSLTYKLATDVGVPANATAPTVAMLPQTFDVMSDLTTVFAVQPGEKFLVSVDAANSNSGAAAFKLGLWFHDESMTYSGSTSSPIGTTATATANGLWQNVKGEIVVPATAPNGKKIMYARLWLRPGNAAGWHVTNWHVRRKTTGELIVDGAITGIKISGDAIDGKTITGATMQSSATPYTGVKFDSDGIRAYNAGGSQTFGLFAATGYVDIVGSLKTSADPQGNGGTLIDPAYGLITYGSTTDSQAQLYNGTVILDETTDTDVYHGFMGHDTLYMERTNIPTGNHWETSLNSGGFSTQLNNGAGGSAYFSPDGIGANESFSVGAGSGPSDLTLSAGQDVVVSAYSGRDVIIEAARNVRISPSSLSPNSGDLYLDTLASSYSANVVPVLVDFDGKASTASPMGVTDTFAIGALYQKHASWAGPTLERVGDRVHFHGTITVKGSTTFVAGTAYVMGVLPVGFRPAVGKQVFQPGAASPGISGWVGAYSNGNVEFALSTGGTMSANGWILGFDLWFDAR